MGSGAYDVFVSYARSDEAAAAELNGWLCSQGFSTFFDRRALRPGLRWVPALEEAIGRSKAVAILVGQHGIGNTQQYERELALVRQTGDQKFPVIPVLMPGCDSPPTGFLQLLTWVDFSKCGGFLEQTERLADLRAALHGETVAVSATRASICPYRGLEPFREEDAAFFCGRDDAIRELVARVQEHMFVAVVGPSGSGKSSLVFAGLLPALRKQSLTTMWDVVTLRPGKSPLNAIAEAFGVMPNNSGPAAIDTFLEGEAAAYRAGDKDKLARIVDRRLDTAPEKPDRLLIYVDQWEELYAMAPLPEHKERVKRHSADVETFIALLVAAASGAGSRASVVMTVRADFYNHLIQGAPIDALLPKQQVNIPAMRREDLRSAIETPAKTAGLSLAPPQLLDRILNDVGLEEGRLPLLQFALKETWQRRAGDRLTAEAYTAVGGVAGAIEKTAQDAYERLTPLQKDAARRLFLRLVTPGEGQADTRARSAIPDDLEQRDIVSLFANPRTRLLVTGYVTPQGAARAGSETRSTVEVAHEALIQRWPTLRDWVRANRENLRARAAILRAKGDWEEHSESEKFLLDPGVQLERGRALLDNPGDVAIDDIRDYVGRSIEKDQRRVDAEREADLADQKRIAEAAERVAEEEKKAAAAGKRTARVAVGGLAAALLVAAVAVWEYFQAAEATQLAKAHLREAQIAQSRFLADLASQQRNSANEGIAVLLALEALPDAAANNSRPYVSEAELQLDGASHDLRERLVLSHEHQVLSAAFSPDGKEIVTASEDKTARIWNATTGLPIVGPLNGHEGWVRSAAFSPDGKRIVTASEDRTARIWDAATGQQVGEPLRGHENLVLSAAFSPDGKRIVTGSEDRTARIWDAATGQQVGEPLRGHENWVMSAAFSPDGKRIVTASSDQTARIWDAATGQPIGEPLRGHENWVRSAAFSPDGKRIVTASLDKTARLWDAATGQQIGSPLRGHEAELMSAAFSPDGKSIVTASWDKTARLWDATNGELIGEPLGGHDAFVISAAFSPDGKRIVTASLDKTARIWDVKTDQPISDPFRGHLACVNSAAFSPDGKRIVSASRDKTARIWDTVTGLQVGEPLTGHDGAVSSAAFSPDGRRIVTASEDNTARQWDAATGQPIGEPLRGHLAGVNSAAFSPDSKQIVTASEDKTARIWDAATGQPIGKPLRGHDGAVYRAAFSSDGKRIVTASNDSTARQWDVATGQPIGAPLRGHDNAIWTASFSPDSKRIATASVDNTVRLWDAATGLPIGEPLRGHRADVNSAAFSPNGQRIVTASADMTARIWDVATGKEIGELRGHHDKVTSAAFSPDGKHIVTASADNMVRVWDAATNTPDTQALILHARAAIPRCLTPAQRTTFFLPLDPPSWCVEMKKWPYDTAGWKQWLADKRAGKNLPMPAAP